MAELEKIKNMLDLQDEFNSQVNLNWKQANFNWKTAIFVETGEAIDSLGYKWWKHQEPDINNFEVELIDIWHFLMSYMMTQDIKNLDVKIKECFSSLEPSKDNINDLLTFNSNIISTHTELSSLSFIKILKGNGFTIDSLYEKYIVKNCLNKFRQDFGYKNGSYRKMWKYQDKMVEDNVVAFDLVKQNESFKSLYNALEQEYSKGN